MTNPYQSPQCPPDPQVVGEPSNIDTFFRLGINVLLVALVIVFAPLLGALAIYETISERKYCLAAIYTLVEIWWAACIIWLFVLCFQSS